jgi:hypothetical protein
MSTSTDAGKASNHYQLLRLKPFESDQDVIRNHFHKLADQVRKKIAAEPYVPKWKAMLADLTRAMLVLCDARRKAEYDIQLGHTVSREPKPPELTKILRARKVLDDSAIDRAKKFAATVNIDLHEAIIQQKLLVPDVVMPLYADSLGLPFVQLSDLTIDETLIQTVPAIMARQHSLTPVMMDSGHLVVASPNPLRPEIEEQLRLRFDSSVRQVIVTKAAIDEAIAKHYPREAAAAQITAGTQAATKSHRKSGNTTQVDRSQSRLSREELRSKKLKIGGISGAFSAMVIILGGTQFTDWGAANSTKVQLIGLVVGGIAFGIGYFMADE